ncbi:uncharacterized protein B0I36DRAFT_369568 [Microdochium trichocladiopsis]|uniref:Uncharacterized protein n=1 Tax=Microdochium trichocladiopsis TaxID=1682393 RepID=A0A9P8XSL1_9PEZI|nr:uncharacterized protein B0I36DRAFT_369568 [Microdochium trichocladiopsis]KAH7014633.1 hypothetical protein B0I36DRAFT_369568 [Microdochium trichocladiopsis]
MGYGIVTARALLANPGHVHCGPDDPVKGHVQLDYRYKADDAGAHNTNSTNPTSSHIRRITEEFHGRVNVMVTLQGRLDVKRWDLDSQEFFEDRVPLFLRQLLLSDGIVRLASAIPTNTTTTTTTTQTVNFSFELSFPQQPCQNHVAFNTVSDQPLPLSTFTTNPLGDVRVRYEVAASITFPGGQDVKVDDQSVRGGFPVSADFKGTLVLYELAPLRRAEDDDDNDDDNDSGGSGSGNRSRRRKKRASLRDRLLGSFSRLYSYDCHVSCSSDVHRSQPLVLQIRIVPSKRRSTARDMDRVRVELMGVKVQVKGLVQGDGSTIFASGTAANGNSIGTGTRSSRESSSTTLSDSSYASGHPQTSGAQMNPDNDWTQVIALSSVLNNVPSSVTPVDI